MRRIVLRLFLALCLVLTGIGNAVAAAAMPVRAGTAHHAIPAPAHDTAQAAGACVHGTGEAAATLLPVPPANHPHDCAGACCAQGACNCPCMHLAHALPLETWSARLAAGRSGMSAGHSPDRPTLVRHDPIRPPIR